MIGSIGSASSLFGQVDFSALRQQREAKMFQEMDADGSGAISKDEFTSWDKTMREQMPAMGGTSEMPSAEDIFAALDSDADGALSQTELSSMGEKMRALREAQMFKEADADSNGSLSKDEFAAWQDQIQARMSEMIGAAQTPSADDIFSEADTKRPAPPRRVRLRGGETLPRGNSPSLGPCSGERGCLGSLQPLEP
jgi:hypothetical protein